MRVGYFSAYYRGLETLLDIWPIIYEQVPEAKLDIYYGWGSWDALEGARGVDLKNRITAKLKALEKYGVTEHGRVSHEELAKVMKQTNVWAYPTEFPEIHCITALKAQEAGCWPVVTNVGALKETVVTGDKIDCANISGNQFGQLQFVRAVVEALKLNKKGVPVPGTDWSEIAKQWKEVIA
jgi:glycosyltransferase involved in cell wall biosynthesis